MEFEKLSYTAIFVSTINLFFMGILTDVKIEYLKWKNAKSSKQYFAERKETKIHRNQDFSYDKLISLLLDKKITEKSAALTYYTLTSLPAFALIFKLLGSFDFKTQLVNIVDKAIPLVDVNEVAQTADNYYGEGNAFVIISILFSLYSCWSLKNSVKSIGHDIWNTRSKNEKKEELENNDTNSWQKIKNELKSLAVNLCAVILGCMIIGGLSLLIIYVLSNLLTNIISSNLINEWFSILIGLLLPLLLFVAGNKFILGEKVDLRCAFFGAKKGFFIILLFDLVMIAFRNHIIGSYSKYGLYAPIFIAFLWLFVFWLSFLIGFASTCAKKKSYILYMQKESNNVSKLYRLFLTIKAASYLKKNIITNDLNKNDTSVCSEKNIYDKFYEEMQIPVSLSKKIIGDLIDIEFISDVKDKGWVLKKDISTVGELVKKLLQKGDYDLNRDYISEDEGFWKDFTNNMLYWENDFKDKPLDEVITKTTELGALKSNAYSYEIKKKMNIALENYYKEKNNNNSSNVSDMTYEPEDYTDLDNEKGGILKNIFTICGIVVDRFSKNKSKQ